MKNNIMELARKDIVAMSAYRSARSQITQGKIFLDANENPFNELAYNRYPKPQPEELIARFSEIYNVNPTQMLITRGSDEGIDLLLRLFCRADQDKILICPPTYGMYKIAAQIQGAKICEIPLKKADGFALDVKAILQGHEPAIKLIFLCSPNNPTGNLLSKEDILFLCQTLYEKSIIVIDEAYIEFSDAKSLACYINTFPNLIILRTLSKAYGLAAVRCGIMLADSVLIKLLQKIIAPYPIPTPVTEIVLQQLNATTIHHKIDTIRKEKEKMMHYLEKLSFINKVWKSDTNYLLIESTKREAILHDCLQSGIILRDRSAEHGLYNCIRITIGSPEENASLREVLSHV